MKATNVIESIKTALAKGEHQVEKGELLESDVLESINGIISNYDKAKKEDDNKVFIAYEEWDMDGDRDNQFLLFDTKEKALERMSANIRQIQDEWNIKKGDEDWEIDDTPTSYFVRNDSKCYWYECTLMAQEIC